MTIETDVINNATKAENTVVAAETRAASAVSRNANWIVIGIVAVIALAFALAVFAHV